LKITNCLCRIQFHWHIIQISSTDIKDSLRNLNNVSKIICYFLVIWILIKAINTIDRFFYTVWRNPVVRGIAVWNRELLHHVLMTNSLSSKCVQLTQSLLHWKNSRWNIIGLFSVDWIQSYRRFHLHYSDYTVTIDAWVT